MSLRKTFFHDQVRSTTAVYGLCQYNQIIAADTTLFGKNAMWMHAIPQTSVLRSVAPRSIHHSSREASGCYVIFEIEGSN